MDRIPQDVFNYYILYFLNTIDRLKVMHSVGKKYIFKKIHNDTMTEVYKKKIRGDEHIFQIKLMRDKVMLDTALVCNTYYTKSYYRHLLKGKVTDILDEIHLFIKLYNVDNMNGMSYEDMYFKLKIYKDNKRKYDFYYTFYKDVNTKILTQVATRINDGLLINSFRLLFGF